MAMCTDSSSLAFSLFFLLLDPLVPLVSLLEPRDSAPLLVVVVRPRGLQEETLSSGGWITECVRTYVPRLKTFMVHENHACSGSEIGGSANVVRC